MIKSRKLSKKSLISVAAVLSLSFHLFISPSLPAFILILLPSLPPAADLSPLSLSIFSHSLWARGWGVRSFSFWVAFLLYVTVICWHWGLRGGPFSKKYTALHLTTLCIINSWARDLERGAPTAHCVLLGLAGWHVDQWEGRKREVQQKKGGRFIIK